MSDGRHSLLVVEDDEVPAEEEEEADPQRQEPCPRPVIGQEMGSQEPHGAELQPDEGPADRLDEGFVGSTFVESSASHAAAETASDIARQQQQAIQNSQGEMVIETIRNRGPHVGRNDPCPCKSGKKYKNCCMRKMRAV